jgi:hypothetical protein
VVVKFENQLNPGWRTANFVRRTAGSSHTCTTRTPRRKATATRTSGRGLCSRAVGPQPLPELSRRRRRQREAVVPAGSTITSSGYTGANVYRGLVGLYPFTTRSRSSIPATRPRGCGCRRAPQPTRTAPSRSTTTSPSPFLRLHARRRRDAAPATSTPAAERRDAPEWWGMTFFKHYPDRGFVGDIFTVNGKAFPC